MRIIAATLGLLVACSTGIQGSDEMAPAADAGAEPDAGEEDIVIEPSECEPQLYFPDVDGDGFGDATASGVAGCEPPEGHVLDATDCADGDASMKPGAPEMCDAVDNDCNPGTAEVCPASCTAIARPDGHTYVFCDDNKKWPDAQAVCASQGLFLARIDDAAEEQWIKSTHATILGNDHLWIGAQDRNAEDNWVWDDGTQFWQGRENGLRIANRYENWQNGEPNDEPNNSDCAILAAEGGWRDRECGDSYNYVCERY